MEIIDINLLPGRKRKKHLRKEDKQIIFIGFSIFFLLVAMYGGVWYVKKQKTDLLNQLNNQINALKSVQDLLNKDDPVSQVVEPLANSLAIEIQRSVNYYFKKFNDGKVMKTILLLEGGTANLKGLKEYLEDKTSLPTGINRLFTDIAHYDPNLFTKEYLEEMAPIFSVATGLALREHPESSIEKARKSKKPKAPKKEVKNIFKYKKG